MKKHLFTLPILILALYACGPTYVVRQEPRQALAPSQEPEAAPAPEVSYQNFYDQLSPYGQWIDYPGYGNVWQPNVDPYFKPYASNGHWVYSEAGWVWASDYSWGWATFHYGRWFYEDGYGWMWIPGHEWAPAWVSWRRSPEYYGWAPLGPNVSISFSMGGGYNPPSHYWNFVPQQYVASPQINNYYVNEQKNVTIINKTTVINNTTIVNNNITNNNINNTNITNNNVTNNNTSNTTNNNISNNRVTNNVANNYAGGPDPREVERVTGAPLKPVAIRTSRTPGEQLNNGQLAIYRPRVNPTPATNSSASGMQPKPAPARVIPFSQAKPVNMTSYGTGTAPRSPQNNYAPINRNNTMTPGTFNSRPPANAPVNQPAANPPAGNPVYNRPVNPPGTFNSRPPANAPVNQPAANPPAGNPVYNRPVNPPGTFNSRPPVNAPVTQPAANQPAYFSPNRANPGQRGTNTNTTVKPVVKTIVKPPPPAHPGDDKPKEKNKD